MADSRSSRAKKNIFVSLLCQIVTLLCGLIVPKMLLDTFGSEVYGATTSIAQFLAYVTLLEGGIGGVARAVLYKPLANHDNNTISAIMAELRKFFRVIAGIFAVYVILLAFSFKSISDLEQLDLFSSFMLVIVISISTFGQYFIGISNSILLQAAQRSYITNFINLMGTIVNTIVTVILVTIDCDIITVKLVSSLIFLLKPVALWLYVQRLYKVQHMKKSDTRYLTQKWSGLGQHIAYFLHSNTDIVVLTCFSTLKNVAVYSVYYMVISHMQNLAMSFVSGMEALFGDMIAKDEKKQLQKTVSLYETMISVVSILLFATTAVMIVPFVKLYTSQVKDTNYEVPLFALILTLSGLLYCLRLPYHSLVIAAGHFKSTNFAAYGEAIINIVLSITLLWKFGLVGVALATVCATLFRFVYYVIYLAKNIFYRNVIVSVKRFIVNAVAFVIIFVAGRLVISFISIDSYLTWAYGAAVVAVISLVVILAANFVFYRNESIDMLKQLIKKRKT